MNIRQLGLGALCALAFAASAQAQAPLTKPEEVGLSSKTLSMIHDALKLHIDNGQIPGAIVLVARNGKVVHFEAQGASGLGSGQPMRTDTIFGIASLSKPVTAVAVMMLVEQGKIGLDDPVSKFIPEFGVPRRVRVLKPGSPPPAFTPLPGVQPAKAEWGEAQYEIVPAQHPVTVRTLLTHTSGIQIFGIENDWPKPTPGDNLAQRIPKYASLALEYEPGSRWAYSNGPGIDVLGRVVEVASGQPFNVFLQQNLFGPLGMKDTGFGVRRTDVARASPMFAGGRAAIAEETTYFSGAAGLWSTVGDYSQFAEMLAAGGTLKGHQYLKPETVKAMSSNQIGPLVMGGYPPMAMPPEGLKFGLGMLTVTNPVAAGTQVPAGSFGWDGVGTRRFWALPEQNIAMLIWVPLIGPAAAPLQRDVESIVMRSIIPAASPAAKN